MDLKNFYRIVENTLSIFISEQTGLFNIFKIVAFGGIVYPKITWTFAGGGSLSTFHLWMALLFSGLLLWSSKRIEEQSPTIKKYYFLLIFILLVGSFLGARLFHIFYEAPLYYYKSPLKIFQFWNGGFVFYGGLFGGSLPLFIFIYWKSLKENLNFKKIAFQILDFLAPMISTGYALGRLACFLNGCCYGIQCDRWFCANGRWPTTLFSFFYEGFLSLLLIYFEKRKFLYKKRPGNIFFIWLPLHSLGRILMEANRSDFRGPFLLNLSISIWISLFFIIISSIFWIYKFHQTHS